MNPLDQILNRAIRFERALRWLQEFLLLGCSLCLAGVIAGVLVRVGWVSEKRWALLLFLGMSVLFSLPLIPWARRRLRISDEKSHLAAALERTQPSLEDRLNAVCYLEKQPPAPVHASFIARLKRQAVAVLSPVVVWPRANALSTAITLLAFVFAASTAAYLNHRYAPWRQLSSATKLPKNQPGQHQAAPPLTPTHATPEPSWGEVRITKPGADVQAAASDSIPLQVEAAASQPLVSLSWSVAVNARKPTACPLALTNRQLFAVAQTNIQIPGLGVSEGDLLTYFATAKTREASYTSDVYFVEIRAPQEPSRNDAKQGNGGSQQQPGGNLSSLIRQQQEVVRETHRLARSPGERNAAQDKRKKLSNAESDLANGTRHLQAALEVGSEPGAKGIDSLTNAGAALIDSATALGNDAVPLALDREQAALLDLIRAQKVFGAASEGAGQSVASSTEETQNHRRQTPADKLDQITEFRNESAAAQAFLNQTIEQQRGIAEDSAKSSRMQSSEMLADREKQLRDSLNDFAQHHPRPFNNSQQETRRALGSMGAAADSLRNNEATNNRTGSANPGNSEMKNEGAPEVAVTNALHELETLNSSLKTKDAQRQLTDAYKLKRILDDLVNSFDKFASENTNSSANPNVPSAVRQARQTIDQLKSLADRETGTFREPLRDALSDKKLSPLRETLSDIEQSQEGREQQQLAGEARDGLGAISKAFDQSRPSALQRGTDSAPESSPGNSLDNAVARLKQLLNQRDATSGRLPEGFSAEEALQELQRSVQQAFGNTSGGQQVLASLQELLHAGLSDADLIRILQQVERLRTAQPVAEGPALPEGFALDPDRLPPAYRDRIQSYFQRLSEQ